MAAEFLAGISKDATPLWARGLVPIAWYEIPPATTKPIIELTGALRVLADRPAVAVSSWVIYLDESGGAHSAESLLRRAGWGLAVLRRRTGCWDADCEIIGGVSASLEGEVQTANRSALAALAYATKHFTGRIEVVPDSKYVVAGINDKKRHLLRVGINSDLWHEIGTHLQGSERQ